MKHKTNILLIFGGNSPEYEVSCCSAGDFVGALDRSVFSLHTVGVTKTGQWLLTEATAMEIINGIWIEKSCPLYLPKKRFKI